MNLLPGENESKKTHRKHGVLKYWRINENINMYDYREPHINNNKTNINSFYYKPQLLIKLYILFLF